MRVAMGHRNGYNGADSMQQNREGALSSRNDEEGGEEGEEGEEY